MSFVFFCWANRYFLISAHDSLVIVLVSLVCALKCVLLGVLVEFALLIFA